MSGLIIPIAAEYTGKAAFKQAQKNVDTLERSVKKLAGAFGVGLSTTAIVAFGKATVKAFAEDERAAVQLANTLDNLGLSFANPQIASFIENLSRSASISDDQLRPAFQKLIQTTGSLTASQEMLNQAISVSRATGIDLATVSSDLAQAFVGNTKGLRKYNLGLTQAELKASSFADIQERLNALFSGANAKYLETYAGKMEALTVAAGEAKETIGKGLVDAFTLLAGEDANIQTLTNSIESLADNINSVTIGIAEMVKEFKTIPILGKVFDVLNWAMQNGPLGLLLDLAMRKGRQVKSSALAPSSANTHLAELSAASNATAQKAAEAAATKRAKELAAAQNKNTKALKDQAALKKAGSIFDQKQIQIIAALKGQISEEERKRLELQLALETENVTEAQRLTLEIAKSQGLTDSLAKTLASLPAASNPFAAWKGYLDELELQAKRIAEFKPEVSNVSIVSDGGITDASSFAGVGATTRGYNPLTGEIGGSMISVQIDGKEIASAIQNQNNSGNYTGFSRLGDWRTL